MSGNGYPAIHVKQNKRNMARNPNLVIQDHAQISPAHKGSI